MKAVLIDPHKRTITNVEHDGDYKQIYELIDARPFDVVKLGHFCNQDEVMFIDDEGLYRENQAFFSLFGFEQPFAGKALILGSNDAGETVATNIDASHIARGIAWRDIRVSGWTETTEEKDADMPWGGKGFKIVGPHPIFEDK